MSTEAVTVRAFALLHDVRRSRNEPSRVQIEVPEEGMTAFEIADRLGLPLELVNGAFLNGTLYTGDVVVYPGDRLGLVPLGTPAFHPAFFGSRTAS